jgi:hypothetical protein
MAKRKPVKQETIDDLVTYAQRVNMPDGSLDDELWDACQSAAKLAHENIKDAVLMDQIEFLHNHGYTISRIRELIDETVIG